MPARSPDEVIHTKRRSYTIAELRARCRVVEPGVVYFLEIPYGCVAAFEAFMDILRELGQPFGDYVVVVDLADATRPRPDLMEYLLKAVRANGIHWCVVQPGSSFMRAVVRFVLARMAGIRKLSVHESVEDALPTARAVLRKAASA